MPIGNMHSLTNAILNAVHLFEHSCILMQQYSFIVEAVIRRCEGENIERFGNARFVLAAVQHALTLVFCSIFWAGHFVSNTDFRVNITAFARKFSAT